jgi:hypothetical protein
LGFEVLAEVGVKVFYLLTYTAMMSAEHQLSFQRNISMAVCTRIGYQKIKTA